MLKEQDNRSKLRTWVAESSEIMRRVAPVIEKPSAMERVEKAIAEIDRTAINVVVTGSANTGKSSLINQLVGKQILPTSVLPDSSVAYIQSSDVTTPEGVALKRRPTEWLPLEDISKGALSSASADNPLLLSLKDDWLKRHQLCLIEMPPLDLDLKDTAGAFTSIADCLLLITDATAAMRRSEIKLLEDSAKQSMPTVVVIAKMDRLLEEERPSVVDYVSKFASSCDRSILVVQFSDRTTETKDNIQAIRAAIEAKLNSADISSGRVKRIAHAVLQSLAAVELNIKTVLEGWDNRPQADDIRERRHQVDVQTLEWQRIKQKLDNRRRKVDSMLKAQLQNNHASLLDELLYELDTTNDFREWWRRDATARLAQAMQKTSERVTAAINQQVISDIEWLQAEAQKQFDFPLKGLEQPDAQVTAVPVPQKSLVVSDENMANVIARIGAAAAMILARVLGPRVGIRNAEMAAGAITGLATEQLILQSGLQEKSKIRDELSETLKKVERAYIAESSRQLADSYGQIVADLQHQQSLWQKSQAADINAAERGTDGNSKADLQQLLNQVDRLKAEIKATL